MRRMVRPAALVANFYDLLLPEQRTCVQALHDVIVGAVPQLECSIKWGNLTFGELGRNLIAVVPHKGHANVQVFNGALLSARFPQLEGVGKGMRHLKVRYSQPVDGALLERVVRACVDAARQGGMPG